MGITRSTEYVQGSLPDDVPDKDNGLQDCIVARHLWGAIQIAVVLDS